MTSRLSVDDVLSRIMHDSDSGSELEVSDSEYEMSAVPGDGSGTEESPSSCSSEDDVVQQHGRCCPIQRGRRNAAANRVMSRGRGRGRGLARARVRNSNPPELIWEPVDFYDNIDTDWLWRPQRRGVLIDTSNYSPVDYFKYSFPEEVFDIMATNMNLYARQFLETQTNLLPHSRFHKWTETSSNEMKAYCALQIAMGINSKPELAEYWGTHWLTSNKFCDVMSRNNTRF